MEPLSIRGRIAAHSSCPYSELASGCVVGAQCPAFPGEEPIPERRRLAKRLSPRFTTVQSTNHHSAVEERAPTRSPDRQGQTRRKAGTQSQGPTFGIRYSVFGLRIGSPEHRTSTTEYRIRQPGYRSRSNLLANRSGHAPEKGAAQSHRPNPEEGVQVFGYSGLQVLGTPLLNT
jgi:hypothetical protein